MSLSLELAFCDGCVLSTEHIVRRKKDGSIKSLMCRRCKRKVTMEKPAR